MADGVNVLDQASGDGWHVYNSDCVDVLRGLPADSLHYSIFSPPFSSLYTFSDSERDVSNNRDDAVFWRHFRFVIDGLARAMMPGRLVSIHCMQLPTSKLRDGFIGLRDFRGRIIREFAGDEAEALRWACDVLIARRLRAMINNDDTAIMRLSGLIADLEREAEIKSPTGFIYHSEVCIRKDPVAAMQRTKAIGLLHKQVVKDSALSRMAIADYVVTLRKPGDNPEPVAGGFAAYHGSDPSVAHEDPGTASDHVAESYSVKVWQRYAESIWLDINQSDTLSRIAAREEADERHISPLQLTVIRRCIDLWSNPGDTVFSPFAGIGSAGYCAIGMDRKFVGAELKASYFRQAVANLREAQRRRHDGTLFEAAE